MWNVWFWVIKRVVKMSNQKNTIQKGRLANGFKLWQFENFHLNWVIWTKNLNYCLGQIILFENIIWIVVWIYVKLVIWVIKRVVKMSEEFDFEGFEWLFIHLDFIQKKVTKRRFRLKNSFEWPKMGSNPFAK